jgi:hypothetical protein
VEQALMRVEACDGCHCMLPSMAAALRKKASEDSRSPRLHCRHPRLLYVSASARLCSSQNRRLWFRRRKCSALSLQHSKDPAVRKGGEGSERNMQFVATQRPTVGLSPFLPDFLALRPPLVLSAALWLVLGCMLLCGSRSRGRAYSSFLEVR